MNHFRIFYITMFVPLLCLIICLTSCSERVEAEKEATSEVHIYELDLGGEKILGEGLAVETIVTGNILTTEMDNVEDLQSLIDMNKPLTSGKCVCSKGNKCCCGPNGTCCNTPGRCCCSWPVKR